MAVKQDGTLAGRSTDEYLAVLGDDHRRAVVEILAEKERAVILSPLAREVTAKTQDVALETPTEAEIERMELELHHNHLPKLEDAGVVDYDHEINVVAPTEGLGPALRALELVN